VKKIKNIGIGFKRNDIGRPQVYVNWQQCTVVRYVYNRTVAVCSFARLFAKLSRPGDSEVTFSVFESSCHLLLPI